MTTIALLWGVAAASPAEAARLKELVDVEGFRDNPLVGVGVVVGLRGTGDRPGTRAMQQPLASLLRNLGVNIEPRQLRARNVAVVMVTGRLPPYARSGVRFDVAVSSIGTARTLQGGTLIATALRGVDRQVYAIAQGQLTVGGYEARSELTGSLQRRNHVTVARIPSGGTVERAIEQTLPQENLVLLLKDPDFTTAQRIVDAINSSLGEKTAAVRDPGAVQVAIADGWKERVVGLVATLEALEANPDAPARVVVDERTGTLVVGASVILEPAAIAYGGLTVRITERFAVSQPRPFSQGNTIVIPDSIVEIEEEEGSLKPMERAATLGDVARALNAMQVTPRDLIAIIQALKAAGSLRAEIQAL